MNHPEIEFVLRDPATSDWMRSALQSALRRDPVDAANDAEELGRLLTIRCNVLLDSLRAQVRVSDNLLRPIGRKGGAV